MVHVTWQQQVASMLRDKIFSSLLAPGSFADELALRERPKISLTALHEALMVLIADCSRSVRPAVWHNACQNT